MGSAVRPSLVQLLSLTGGTRSLLADLANAARVAAASEAAAAVSVAGGPAGGDGAGRGGGTRLPTGTDGCGAIAALDALVPSKLLAPGTSIGSTGVASAARNVGGGRCGPLLFKWLPSGVAPLP